VEYGILLIRLLVGLAFAAHGSQKLLGWFGGGGLVGTNGFFASLGYRAPAAMALLAGLTELGCGLLFAAGLATPLAALGLAVVMLNAIVTVKWPLGFFAGYELEVMYLAVAVAVCPVRINEDVDVREDQPPLSIRSSRAALSSRSTPGWRPPLPNVGSSIGIRSRVVVFEKLLRTASPTTSLRDRPSRAARSFASAKSSGGRSTVVRMHQSVTPLHHDATAPAAVTNRSSGTCSSSPTSRAISRNV